MIHHFFGVHPTVGNDLQQVHAFAKLIQIEAGAIRQMLFQEQAAGQIEQAHICIRVLF